MNKDEKIRDGQQYAILDDTPMGIFILRRDFSVLFWNRCLEEWTKIKRIDIIGRPIGSRFPHLVQPKYTKRLDDIFAGGPPVVFSSQLHTHIIPCSLPDGQQRIQHTTVSPIEGPDRKSFHALFVIQDVTDLTHRIRNYRAMRDRAVNEVTLREKVEWELREAHSQLEHRVKERTEDLLVTTERLQDEITQRKCAEETLRASEERYRTLFENAGDAIFILEAEGENAGRIVDANQAAALMHGYTVEELLTKSITDLDTHNASAAVPGLIRNILDGQWVHAEITHRRKDGAIFPVGISAGLLDVDDHKYILAIDRDLTERKTTEAFMKSILEAVDEAFIVIDRDFKVLSANTAYSKQVKLPVDEILGKRCFEISHQRQIPCWQAGEECTVKRTFETGHPHMALHIHHDSNGNHIYVETKSFPMMNTSGEVITAIEIINDISAKRKLEEQLRHAQKMEAIGTLTGGIAHDFNNLLTVILGHASAIQNMLDEHAPLRPAMDSIFTAAQRAKNLTRSLLAFSRKQVMSTSVEDLNDIVLNVEKLLQRVIGEDIKLVTNPARSSLNVMADRGQMEQVLMNLCTNSRDAMPDGGLITISIEPVRIEKSTSFMDGIKKPGGFAVLAVSDTGCGMDDKIKGRIYDPFFTTKEVGKGTGLGLSIVHGIITQHNGTITVNSDPGKGTTFKIYLPLIEKVV